jgi:hypothetical protein
MINVIRIPGVVSDMKIRTNGNHGFPTMRLLYSLGITRRRWDDNINMDLREIGIDGAT